MGALRVVVMTVAVVVQHCWLAALRVDDGDGRGTSRCSCSRGTSTSKASSHTWSLKQIRD